MHQDVGRGGKLRYSFCYFLGADDIDGSTEIFEVRQR